MSRPALGVGTLDNEPYTVIGVAPENFDGSGQGERADVYLPPGEGPFPVVLERTPYNK